MSIAAVETEKPRTMQERIDAELDANPLGHEWIVAAEVPVDTKTARRAAFRLSFRTEAGMRVDALEVYCRKCKRPQDEVGDEDCSAKIDNTHLIGGNPGVRAKRKVHAPVGRIIQPGPVDRRGLKGFSAPHRRPM